MKTLSLLLTFLLATQAFAIDFGTPDQVYVVPHAGGRAQFGQVDLTKSAALKNQLAVGNGGTGLASGTSGGIPYFNATSTMASSGLLASGGIVLGGGAGASPTTITGTADQVCREPHAGGAPAFGSLDLSQSAAVGSSVLGHANGGTDNATILGAFQAFFESVATSAGDLIYGGASGVPTRLPKGSDGQVLSLSSGLPSWSNLSGLTTVPSIQKFTSTGTTTGYLFTVTSANATVGATYTNNGNTYTVLATISAGTQLFTSQASAPLSSGTLTKATGTGDATITFSANQALATVTISGAPLYLKVKLVGGGGGGGGGGTSAQTTGGSGSVTAFGPSLLIANGGTGGAGNGPGGTGGTASLGTATGTQFTGGTGYGGEPALSSGNTLAAAGGGGAPSPFGGAGSNVQAGAGVGAISNSGSGGGGGGSNGTAGATGGGGGGAGGFVDALVTSPAASYVYTIGSAGTGGSAGVNGFAGANGGSGYLEVEVHYQ